MWEYMIVKLKVVSHGNKIKSKHKYICQTSCVIFIGSVNIQNLTLNSSITEDSLLLFTLTCVSTGGPATNVTWTREADILTESTSTILINAMEALYTHTLTVTGRYGGLYTCTVTNKKSFSSANITVEGKHRDIPFALYHV